MTGHVVGTALTPGGPVAHRGFVDLVDCTQGVRGWALNLSAPQEPVRLELLVGEIVVADLLPDQPRADISEALDEVVYPGFAFDAIALAVATELAEGADDDITVRIAGTDLFLPMAGPPPKAAALLNEMRNAQAAPRSRPQTADLELLLEDLRSEAGALAEQPLRPIPENLQGYIETLAIDAAGQVWIVGWMRRGHLTEFSAVISERRKIPAAAAVMTFARSDLPSDSCGIIGVLASTWRPSSATSEFFLFFGGGGRFHLKAHVPLRIITAPELAAEYEGIREKCGSDGRALALQRMLTSLESWLPTRSAAQAYATETSIDRVLLVPGLGCLVEGWVVSPMKRVEGLRLRIGGAVMSAQADATYWKPRRDLLAGFPGSDALVARAGFVALFAGDAEPEDFADPVIKVVFQGGASANFDISPKVFRRLGHSATIDDALMFFPALQEEAFFPRFAEAAIRAQRGAMNPPVKLTVTRMRRALVLALPEDRCDLFLLFEELSEQCSRGGIDGVTFIASASANRADALWLFRDFQLSHGLPASLLLIDDTAHAFALLPDILREVGAKRFVFLGPGVFLSQAGWRQVRQVLQSTSSDLVFLGLEPEESEQRDPVDNVTARCFGWTTPHFLRWSLTAPPFLGGFHRENGLFRANVAHVVHHGAARTSRTIIPARIQEAVNSAVYSMGARF